MIKIPAIANALVFVESGGKKNRLSFYNNLKIGTSKILIYMNIIMPIYYSCNDGKHGCFNETDYNFTLLLVHKKILKLLVWD